MQSDSAYMCQFLAHSLLPACLTAIFAVVDASIDESIKDSHLHLPIIQIIFIINNNLNESQKSEYMNMILPTLVYIISLSPNLQTQAAQFCGKGLTHIARNSPEALRINITSLSDEHKYILQSGIRVALEQQAVLEQQQALLQQQQEQLQHQQMMNSQLGGGGVLIKIDLNSFKK